MANTQDVSFVNPAKSTFDPAAELQVKFRRKMAEAMMKNGEQPQSTEVISGVAVKQSPLAALARALQQGLGGYENAQADEADATIQTNRQKMMADAIGKVGTDPNGAASMLAQDPTTAPSGMQIALEMMKDKKAMELAQWKSAHGGDGDTPAAIKITQEAEKRLKAGDVQGANLLLQVAKTYDKGINPFAPVDPAAPTTPGAAPVTPALAPQAIGGYGDAAGSIDKTRSAAKEQGQKDVDLAMNPQIAGGEKTAQLNAQKMSDLESSDASINEFDASVNRFKDVLKETPNSKMGPIAGRYARVTADEKRTNLDSAMNEMTLRAKGLLGMPSANFSDADRDFITDISGGKFAEHGGYDKVVERMGKMANSQRSINSSRRSALGGQPILPNQTPAGAVDYKSKYGLQ